MRRETKIEEIKNILGLAKKANLLALGQDKTIKAALDRKASIIILSADAGGAAERKIRGKAATALIPVLTVATRSQLGQAVGLDSCSAIAVLDEGFARLIINKDDSDQLED